MNDCFGCYPGGYGVPEICESGEHFDILYSSEFWQPRSEMHNDCQSTQCEDVHAWCNEGEETAQAVSDAVAVQDAEALANLIVKDQALAFEERVILFDPAEQRIQVVGCSRSVILDLSLESAFWKTLNGAAEKIRVLSD
ncbi:MAG TPA: hypothetical protein VF981_11705 [Gemmatimonadaceae bacterium]